MRGGCSPTRCPALSVPPDAAVVQDAKRSTTLRLAVLQSWDTVPSALSHTLPLLPHALSLSCKPAQAPSPRRQVQHRCRIPPHRCICMEHVLDQGPWWHPREAACAWQMPCMRTCSGARRSCACAASGRTLAHMAPRVPTVPVGLLLNGLGDKLQQVVAWG